MNLLLVFFSQLRAASFLYMGRLIDPNLIRPPNGTIRPTPSDKPTMSPTDVPTKNATNSPITPKPHEKLSNENILALTLVTILLCGLLTFLGVTIVYALRKSNEAKYKQQEIETKLRRLEDGMVEL